MGKIKGYRLVWDAGPHAEIEIFCPPNSGDNATFQLKYTPPFRGTYRPPMRDLKVNLKDVQDSADGLLAQLTTILDDGVTRGIRVDVEAPPDWVNKAEKCMGVLGRQLLILVLRKVGLHQVLRGGISLSIVLDDTLLQYPWELLFDGDNYYCMKHEIGRIVNSSKINPPPMGEVKWWDQLLEEPSVLVIGADLPMSPYSPLPGARHEAEAIVEKLEEKKLGLRVRKLVGKEATHENVNAALTEGVVNDDINYQIIHYCGHAHFDENQPGKSSLVLHDRYLGTNLIAANFGATRPILCFINACDSARSGPLTDIYDIGLAFLETGAYLLGSRWKLPDETAREFALSFYDSLVVKGHSIGKSVLGARQVCKERGDFGWASYVFYGDPRVRFVPEVDETPENQPSPSADVPG